MTLADHFAYLGARAAELFFNIELDGDEAEFDFKLRNVKISTAKGAEGSEPPQLAPYLKRHEWIWVETEDGFEVVFGRDLGPPAGDSELAGSRFEGVPVSWFLSYGLSQHWFMTPDGEIFLFDFDGGVADEPEELDAGALFLQKLHGLVTE
jgi:hypothetical protein